MRIDSKSELAKLQRDNQDFVEKVAKLEKELSGLKESSRNSKELQQKYENLLGQHEALRMQLAESSEMGKLFLHRNSLKVPSFGLSVQFAKGNRSDLQILQENCNTFV